MEALVLLAFSAYARGDGPLAGVSLEAALRVRRRRIAWPACSTPPCNRGCGPSRFANWRTTGYRLAERLGVQLPPRRAFGRRAG